MIPKEHGHCPYCEADLSGEGIWDHFYHEFTQGSGYWKDSNGEYIKERRLLEAEEGAIVADEVASRYGASRTKGRWGRVIGIEYARDKIEEWKCPDCGGVWPR